VRRRSWSGCSKIALSRWCPQFSGQGVTYIVIPIMAVAVSGGTRPVREPSSEEELVYMGKLGTAGLVVTTALGMSVLLQGCGMIHGGVGGHVPASGSGHYSRSVSDRTSVIHHPVEQEVVRERREIVETPEQYYRRIEWHRRLSGNPRYGLLPQQERTVKAEFERWSCFLGSCMRVRGYDRDTTRGAEFYQRQ
jgi:hypothetical protein